MFFFIEGERREFSSFFVVSEFFIYSCIFIFIIGGEKSVYFAMSVFRKFRFRLSLVWIFVFILLIRSNYILDFGIRRYVKLTLRFLWDVFIRLFFCKIFYRISIGTLGVI